MNKKLERPLSRTAVRNIRQLRAERGLSQPALAKMAGVSESYLSKVEVGQILLSVEGLKVIAKALKVKPLDLMQMRPGRVRAPVGRCPLCGR